MPRFSRSARSLRVVAVLLFGASFGAVADNLTLFAAASLKEALDEQVGIFSARSGHGVRVSYAGSNALARQIAEAGVQPEIEVFDLGQIVLAQRLAAEGVLTEPFLFQLCLGIGYGAPAAPKVMELMVAMLPPRSKWSAFGVGVSEFDVVAHAAALGGNVRVGLEDNMYAARGRFATNAELVERAVSIVHALNREVASPAEAGELFGVNARRNLRPAPIAGTAEQRPL